MNVLKNRMNNGTPFLKSAALARIKALADNLEITQEQADELTAIANTKGVDALPSDFEGRIGKMEAEVNDLTVAVAELFGGAM